MVCEVTVSSLIQLLHNKGGVSDCRVCNNESSIQKVAVLLRRPLFKDEKTSHLVREIDATWNPIYTSILLMYKKLLALGFIYRNGEITIENLDNE